jgi:hypothetical protein
VAAPQPKNLFDTLRGPGLSHNNSLFPSVVSSLFHLGWGLVSPCCLRGQLFALSTLHMQNVPQTLNYYKVGRGGAMDLMGHVLLS